MVTTVPSTVAGNSRTCPELSITHEQRLTDKMHSVVTTKKKGNGRKNLVQ